MRITDKMRLDWLICEALMYAEGWNSITYLGNDSFSLESKGPGPRQTRQAIDAAIKSERRAKSGGRKA